MVCGVWRGGLSVGCGVWCEGGGLSVACGVWRGGFLLDVGCGVWYGGLSVGWYECATLTMVNPGQAITIISLGE